MPVATVSELPAPDSRPPLTRREHQYLWLMSQGYTPSQAKVIMQTTSTPALSTRVREKLGAVTMEQAVFLACQADIIGPYEHCGQMTGYKSHQGRHEEPCRACRRFFIEYSERNDAPVIRRETLTEPELRMLRAYDSGRTFKQILANWGCSRRTLDDVRTSLYRKLDVAHLPQGAKYHAALNEGRRRGYLKPVRIVADTDLPARRNWGTTDLTDLEVRTLSALTGGTSLHEAGQALGGIPGHSVSARLARIYKKLDVLAYAHGERREHAIRRARDRGYVL